MKPLVDMPSGVMRWPHLQRLVARWWRRWAYALTSCLLGLLFMHLMQPEAQDHHAQAQQAVARLSQQLSALAQATDKPTSHTLPSDLQERLANLPAVTQQDQIWTDWQQVLTAHGLRLQSLRPFATESAFLPASAMAGAEQRASLSHQAAALRLQGRFEDWTRVWATCAEAGPLCTIDRLSVTAVEQASEVQIDVVMRLWMRPTEEATPADSNSAAEGAGVNAKHQHWTWPTSVATRARAGPALFAVKATTVGSLAGTTADQENMAHPSGAASTSTALSTTAPEDLPPDPRHWPVARVRWVGLWQQGSERQAILSAGPHGAKVLLGQRVTQEGHRVVAITDDSVSLRLAQEPVIKLSGIRPVADNHSVGSQKR